MTERRARPERADGSLSEASPSGGPERRNGNGARRGTMIPARARRRFKAESVLMRLVATTGVIAFGVLVGTILVSADVAGWIVGLVVAAISVALSAVLWSSRQL
jgi:hypothetical protein